MSREASAKNDEKKQNKKIKKKSHERYQNVTEEEKNKK